MSNFYQFIFNPFTGKQDMVLKETLIRMKESVDTYNSLPVTGNTRNDTRFVLDTNKAYTWGIDASSGSLSDWVEIGAMTLHASSHQNDGADEISVTGLSGVLADEQKSNWATLTDKPNSSISNIDDAVSKRHTQNTDNQLDSGVVAVDGSDNVSINTNQLYVEQSTGRVGIGTTSIGTNRLNVAGWINISYNAGYAFGDWVPGLKIEGQEIVSRNRSTNELSWAFGAFRNVFLSSCYYGDNSTNIGTANVGIRGSWWLDGGGDAYNSKIFVVRNKSNYDILDVRGNINVLINGERPSNNWVVGIKGKGTTSSTYSLVCRDSSAGNLLAVRDDGAIFFGADPNGLFLDGNGDFTVGAIASPDLFVDHTSKKIGMGTASPAEVLDIQADATLDAHVNIQATANNKHAGLFIDTRYDGYLVFRDNGIDKGALAYSLGQATINLSYGAFTGFRVRSDGAIIGAPNSATADGNLNNSQVHVWVDETSGAQKLKFKVKLSDGTVKSGEVDLT